MGFHLEFHKVWQEQCEATRTIRELWMANYYFAHDSSEFFGLLP
jgi:hypothetical protein